MTLEPIQMLWIGPRLSPLERLSVASFLANGHPVHLYTYARPQGVPEGTTLRDAAEILPEREVFAYPQGFGAGSPAAFANLFRYKLLHERGGTWCDTDMVCVKPLDFLAGREHLFASQRMLEGLPSVNGVTLNVCLMKAPAGSALLRDCLDECASVEVKDLRWGMTGPDLVTRLAAKHGLEDCALPPDVACPVDFFDLNPLLTQPGRLPPEAHAVHCWNEMWRVHGLAKDAIYPAHCLFEQLKRRYL